MRNVSAHQHSFAASEWPFEEPADAAAFTTTRVAHEKLPVLVVSHDEEGEWQFLCGTTTASSDCLVVCLGCAYERDPTLADVSDLPVGWQAQRKHVGGSWERYPPEPEG
jgi:hypothetical protein